MKTVTRNGITAVKPEWMTEEYWEHFEAPRIGKQYGGAIYGKQYEKPQYLIEEQEEGCAGGACTI